MKRLDARHCSLVLVDYQARLMPAIHDGERVVANALLLADAARLLGVPVLGTEQNPGGLGPNVEAVRQRCASTLAKMHFDACEDGLLGQLEALCDAPEVVLAGCEAHVCLLQTALGLLEDEFEVWVVTDACSSRTERNRDAAYDRLASAGAELVSTEMVAFEWLASCENPVFREALALIK